ncbi:glycoside hydrolase family 2 protein [Brevundimonas kwangchunensis]|uniref:Beta-mannosidase B n=1 Tax=Brevundimonas kwangchunensis TaxID=322163 RepID=A0ABP3S6N0_9CAUL
MITLDRWTLLDFAPGEGLGQDAATTGGETWIPVAAPGDTYLALVKAGRLDHPWQGRNETAAAWVRDREWWWRTTFVAPQPAPGDRAELVFEGLDTFAVIYLDGQEIGRADNMFRRWTFDVADHLKPGSTQTLAIRFDPPALAAPHRDLPVWSAFTDRVSRSRRNVMRKAQFGWGWDWGPDLPTVGIWRPARLEVRPAARLADLAFTTLTASADHATARIELACLAADSATVEITLTDPDGRIAFRHAGPADAGLNLAVDLPSPRLWWTADLGAQPFYVLSARLIRNGETIDEATKTVGVRTIAIDESPDPDEPGATFFRFILNGVPIFAKGACWVPSTSFVAETYPQACEQLLDQSVRANMNMLRIWGGGIYEPDFLYDLCDRKGLLVWQDFMFACAHYPEAPDFLESVRLEAEDQVRRLRHHACLAVWCGNNESQAMHRINNDKSGEDGALSGLAIYDDLLPEVLARLDPTTPYRPGSPWGGSNPNGMKSGDVHDWTVWHGVPPIPDDVMIGDFQSSPEGVGYPRYAEDFSRFVSEFGLQAAPALETLERWMDPADLSPESEGFLARIKDEARKADAMMTPVTGLPATLRDYVDYTQWCQAEGLKFGIEHFRRRRPHCSGAVLWQLNDCWPCVSWSLIDHDGVEKASYHAVRRAFAPVLASFRDTGDQIELWITNDTDKPVNGEAIVRLDTFEGAELEWHAVRIEAPAHGHAVIWRGPKPTRSDSVLRAIPMNGLFETARRLPGPIRDLSLPLARPEVEWRRTGPTGLEARLKAPAYLAFVGLASKRPDLRFSDNFLDMAAGEERTVAVTGSYPVDPVEIVIDCWNKRSS